jgi:hypothetical protein
MYNMKNWINKQLVKYFGASWKTSLLGFISGISIVIQDYVERGITDIYRIILAISVYLLGKYAADHKSNAK